MFCDLQSMFPFVHKKHLKLKIIIQCSRCLRIGVLKSSPSLFGRVVLVDRPLWLEELYVLKSRVAGEPWLALWYILAQAYSFFSCVNVLFYVLRLVFWVLSFIVKHMLVSIDYWCCVAISELFETFYQCADGWKTSHEQYLYYNDCIFPHLKLPFQVKPNVITCSGFKCMSEVVFDCWCLSE